MIRTIKINTPLGEMIAAATRDGICLLGFADSPDIDSDFEELTKYYNTGISKWGNSHLRSLRKQLKEYFRGKRKEFSLNLLTGGTEFQKEAWDQLLKIPYGTTISYHHQAEILNNPGAVRAVAHANGSNRIAIVIPCHRVIGADGNLTGYAGGLERKRWLIDHEKKHSGKPVDGILF